MSDPQPLEPQDAFAQLGRIKLAETNLDGVLDTIARLAKLTIPSADEVSVTLMPGKRPRTAAFTSDLALACDERQYEVGHGPCLDASVTATILVVPDMSRETRWPDYTPASWTPVCGVPCRSDCRCTSPRWGR